METKIKLLWIIDGLGPGGAEKLMVPILQNLDKDLFDLRVCVLQEKQGNPLADEINKLGIPVDLIKVKYLRSPRNLPRLIRYLRTYNPNIIHTQLQFSDILGSISGKVLGIPIISTQHTIEKFSHTQRSGWRQKISWFCLRNFAKYVIAVSEETKQHHIELGKLQSRKILTIYNGIDIQQFSDIPPEVRIQTRRSLGIPQTSIVVTTVAVLREQKGLQFMIAALPNIIEKVPNLVYMIVGNGEYADQLKKYASHNQASQNIIFTGHRTDIPDLLTTSDIFVLPTLQDALPTVLFEAMAAKRPIIASNVGGIPEIINHNQNGVLVPPKEPEALSTAVLDLMENPAKINTLVENGYQVVQDKFNISLQVKNLTDLYLRVMNEDQ